MKTTVQTLFPKAILASATLILGNLHACRAVDPLQPGEPLEVAGTHGRFDFISVDGEGRRLLAAHTGNASLDVIDLDTQKVIKVVPTGAAQDCAVDAEAKCYLVSVSKPPQLVVIDSSTLKVTGTVPLAGPADLLAFNRESGMTYVGHDDASQLWIVDADGLNVASAVDLPGDSPEGLTFDEDYIRLFQAMKTGDLVAVVDLATNKVTERWPTEPAKSPHGIALAPEFNGILVAGGNGKLVLMSQKDGHVVASADIAEHVDQIAYDAQMHRVYCASASGRISIVAVEKNTLSNLGDVASSQGAHSIAVDSHTHTVWTAYAKGDSSFVQPFTISK
jgi:DNA-binding beta-propeller fold protein YncE